MSDEPSPRIRRADLESDAVRREVGIDPTAFPRRFSRRVGLGRAAASPDRRMVHCRLDEALTIRTNVAFGVLYVAIGVGSIEVPAMGTDLMTTVQLN